MIGKMIKTNKMREIKFRGKRIDNGEWVYGYYVKDPKGQSRIYYQPFSEATSNTYHFVYPESVGQYTGLKDKNGKEIYEGDVIRSFYSDGRPCIHYFEWDDKFARFECVNADGCDNPLTKQRCGVNQDWIIDYEKELIGNIYENPELLK